LPTKYKFLPILGSVTDTPEGTGTATNVQSSTRNSQSTVTPQKTTSAVSSSSSKGSSNTAAIAGGVVGGIVGAALIAAVVAWFTCALCCVWRRQRLHGTGSGALPTSPRNTKTLREIFFYLVMWRVRKRTDWVFVLSRTPQIQVRTHHRHHPRQSTQRTTAAISLALIPISGLIDRHILAYLSSDRLEPRPILFFEN
jgi:hypothetical protein